MIQFFLNWFNKIIYTYALELKKFIKISGYLLYNVEVISIRADFENLQLA